jgi:sterol desaturase/sphingolipid hydroxylase (fatty acid hydroxylase superfamily)
MSHEQLKYKAVFTLIMSTLMSGIMSLVVTLMNLGFEQGFGWPWIEAWVFSVLIAIPTMLMLTPLVDWLVKHVLPTKK